MKNTADACLIVEIENDECSFLWISQLRDSDGLKYPTRQSRIRAILVLDRPRAKGG